MWAYFAARAPYIKILLRKEPNIIGWCVRKEPYVWVPLLGMPEAAFRVFCAYMHLLVLHHCMCVQSINKEFNLCIFLANAKDVPLAIKSIQGFCRNISLCHGFGTSRTMMAVFGEASAALNIAHTYTHVHTRTHTGKYTHTHISTDFAKCCLGGEYILTCAR